MSLPLPVVAIRATEHSRLQHLARVAADQGDPDALFLMGELNRAAAVHDDDDPAFLRARVTMGSWVTFWTEADTLGVARNTRQLVYPDEYRLWKHRLSVLSPLGAALIGLRVGDQMPFFHQGKMHYVRVESVDKPASNVLRVMFNNPRSMGRNNLPPDDDDPAGPTAA